MIEFHITDPTDIERLTAEFAQTGRLELLWFVAECDWRREPGRLIVRIDRKDGKPQTVDAAGVREAIQKLTAAQPQMPPPRMGNLSCPPCDPA